MFFQAEDGIRAGHVTGVQTCALPIFPLAAGHLAVLVLLHRVAVDADEHVGAGFVGDADAIGEWNVVVGIAGEDHRRALSLEQLLGLLRDLQRDHLLVEPPPSVGAVVRPPAAVTGVEDDDERRLLLRCRGQVEQEDEAQRKRAAHAWKLSRKASKSKTYRDSPRIASRIFRAVSGLKTVSSQYTSPTTSATFRMNSASENNRPSSPPATPKMILKAIQAIRPMAAMDATVRIICVSPVSLYGPRPRKF